MRQTSVSLLARAGPGRAGQRGLSEYDSLLCEGRHAAQGWKGGGHTCSQSRGRSQWQDLAWLSTMHPDTPAPPAPNRGQHGMARHGSASHTLLTSPPCRTGLDPVHGSQPPPHTSAAPQPPLLPPRHPPTHPP